LLRRNTSKSDSAQVITCRNTVKFFEVFGILYMTLVELGKF